LIVFAATAAGGAGGLFLSRHYYNQSPAGIEEHKQDVVANEQLKAVRKTLKDQQDKVDVLKKSGQPVPQADLDELQRLKDMADRLEPKAPDTVP